MTVSGAPPAPADARDRGLPGAAGGAAHAGWLLGSGSARAPPALAAESAARPASLDCTPPHAPPRPAPAVPEVPEQCANLTAMCSTPEAARVYDKICIGANAYQGAPAPLPAPAAAGAAAAASAAALLLAAALQALLA